MSSDPTAGLFACLQQDLDQTHINLYCVVLKFNLCVEVLIYVFLFYVTKILNYFLWPSLIGNGVVGSPE